MQAVECTELRRAAAPRELHEELGLQLPVAGVLGRLNDCTTRSGYVIPPFVAWAESGPEVTLTLDAAEVASAPSASCKNPAEGRRRPALGAKPLPPRVAQRRVASYGSASGAGTAVTRSTSARSASTWLAK